MFDLTSFRESLYILEQWTNQWLLPNLNHVTGLSVGFVFLAGALTSLTPCTLSMLPVTIGYLSGYGAQQKGQAIGQTCLFVLGFATTLTGLGLSAALLGSIYGQTGWGWSVGMGLIAILMGLQLLEVIVLPQWGTITLEKYVPIGMQSYGLGMSFGLASSPCSTPILATLLTWVATTGNGFLGGILLLAYALGSTMPIILIGFFAGALRSILAWRQWSGGINYFSAILLIVFGTFSIVRNLWD